MEMEKRLETTQGNFLIRPYCHADEQNVLELWELTFHKKMTVGMWRWKFIDNPFSRQIMLCLNEENKPLAMYSGIPYNANWNGKDVLFTQLVDHMTHPKYRQAVSGRKGLFIKTGEHFFDVYGGQHASVFHYGFPGRIAFRLGSLLLQYNSVADGGAFLWSDIVSLKGKRMPSFGSVRKITSAGEEFDALWNHAMPFFPFSAKRNRSFVQWRFFDHPENQYQFYVYKKPTGRIIAYAVIVVQNEIATVVDVFSLPRIDGIDKIFQRIKTELLNQGLLQIRAWLPKHHFITEYLLNLGFVQKDEPLGIIPSGRSFYDKLDFNYAQEHIFYSMADADLF